MNEAGKPRIHFSNDIVTRVRLKKLKTFPFTSSIPAAVKLVCPVREYNLSKPVSECRKPVDPEEKETNFSPLTPQTHSHSHTREANLFLPEDGEKGLFHFFIAGQPSIHPP